MDEIFLEFFSDAFKYIAYEERLNTFTAWPFKNHQTCNIRKMAEAGFIYIGSDNEEDAVKCFLCDKHLDGWEATDDPWQEHIKHSPNCPFAKLQKIEDDITLKELLDIRDKLFVNISRSFFNNLTTEVVKVFKFKIIETKLGKL